MIIQPSSVILHAAFLTCYGMHPIDALNKAAIESPRWSYSRDYLKEQVGVKDFGVWADKMPRVEAARILLEISERMPDLVFE